MTAAAFETPIAPTPAPVASLGSFLRGRRVARGLSLRDVSRRLQARDVQGADFWCVGLWERDARQPSLRQFAVLVQVLGLASSEIGQALGLARVSTVAPVSVGVCRWHPSSPSFGTLLRRLRAEQHVSAALVAERLRVRGVTGAFEQSVTAWERGERMPLLYQVVHLLDVLGADRYRIGLALGQVAGRVSTVAPTVRSYRPSTDRPAVLDLGERMEDVRRIMRAQSLHGACLRAGWHEDDLDQFVLEALVRRQRSVWSGYDPARAGVAKYLYESTKKLMLHALASKRNARKGSEALGDEAVDGAVSTLARRGEGAVDRTDPGEAMEASALVEQVVAEVADELGAQAGNEARALLQGGDAPRDVRELVRELLRGRCG